MYSSEYLLYDWTRGEEMDVNKYLARFHAENKKPNYDNLSRLQELHLLTIPFENLDVIRKEPIYLNLQTIFEKIVKHQRGGYCYELNGLFQTLLSALGYDSHLISATVLRPNGEWAKANTHAAILVKLDKNYLVDVGFGAQTPRIPIPLADTIQTSIGETYTTVKQADGNYHLVRTVDGESKTLYRFSTEAKQLVDFHEGCVFNQVSKDSTFTHTDIIALATPKGRITLKDRTLTINEGDRYSKQELTIEEKEDALKNIFSIRLN